MKVFYVNEVDVPKRVYYVKMDNMNVPDNLKGYKLIQAVSTGDLLESVKRYYGLDNCPNISIQLWSAQMYGGTRLDTMEEIPKQYEFIWVRVYIINKG